MPLAVRSRKACSPSRQSAAILTVALTVPDLGESIRDVRIAQWLKQLGDWVDKDEDLVLIDANRKEYTELSRTNICANTWAHPALANGRFYIRDAKQLYCVELPK